MSALVLLASAIVLVAAAPGLAFAAGPDGQLTWAVHISLAPTYFEPAETPGLITPFMIYYALHDALVKPMPGNPQAPSLAESWSVSPDGLAYEFVLRRGVKFHNGDPVTAEDVKFSFERYPNGFDGGTISSDFVYAPIAEAVGNYLGAVGIRVKLTPMERAAFSRAQSEKKLKNLTLGGSAAFGNAATRIEAFVVGGGFYAYGSYPDIDGLFQEQAAETDRKRREAILHRIQQLMHEKAMFLPVMEPAFLNGYGPRVAESGLGLITGHAYSAPYEELKLKPR